MQISENQIANNSLSLMQFIATASLTLAVLSFISPQVAVLGRGLRTTLPALAVSFFAISAVYPSAFFRAFSRFWVAFLFGLLFLVQVAFRLALEDKYEYASRSWHTYFWAPLLALTLLLWIASFAELGEYAVSRLHAWVLFGWCTSLALGLPVLITHPQVARLTMGNIYAKQNASIWAPYGVGEYHVYTSLAICLAPLFAITQRNMKGLWRWFALLLLCMAAAAVMVSTFTMAAVLLILSLFAALLAWSMAVRGISRWLRMLFILLIISFLPILYTLAKQFPQTEFVVKKTERLFKGVSKSGLEKGDETTRGKTFVIEMQQFVEDPLIGYIPNVTGHRDHGHSSFADSLLVFGLAGTALWGAVFFKVFKESLCNTTNPMNRRVLWIGWLVLIIGGVLNPTWHSASALGALFALTLPARNSVRK